MSNFNITNPSTFQVVFWTHY